MVNFRQKTNLDRKFFPTDANIGKRPEPPGPNPRNRSHDPNGAHYDLCTKVLVLLLLVVVGSSHGSSSIDLAFWL